MGWGGAKKQFCIHKQHVVKQTCSDYSLEDYDSLFSSKIGLHSVLAFEVQIGDKPKI